MTARPLKSDYEKDIVKLIGVDFESVPTSRLRAVLAKCADLLPVLFNRDNTMTPTEKAEFLKAELGIKKKDKDKDSAKKDQEKILTCEAFKINYRKRRMGETACMARFIEL